MTEDQPANFPTTSRTLFQRINSDSPAENTAALEEFFGLYWMPLYVFMRSKGESGENAADLVQEFIVRELLDRNQLKSWTPEKGSLRTFLRTMVDRFRLKQFRKESAQKRGGNKRETHISMDLEWAESYFQNSSYDEDSVTDIFDREWASVVIRQTTEILAKRYADKDKREEFDLLLKNLNHRGSEAGSNSLYQEIAVQLNITENAVKQRMRSFKDRFRKTLRATVGNTVSAEEVDDEIRYLMGVIGK